MNLFELFVKIGVDDKASGALKKITGSLGNGLKNAAKVGLKAVTAAAAGITALTTASIKSYAEFEQLIGGAELMFGEAFESVKKNAQDAYKTVQMSQNEYLQQVNGFATGLKTALGGNEQAAADLAHKIIQAEADIIAATGNSAENVQNAFNGIMKSNFTMLDNLQIGITPTKEGFQEVIDKVNDWNKANGEATKYQMGNLADMQSALVDYIEMVGMSGYAQREASETISGSLSSAKAAWSNLVTGFADDSADLDQLIGNLTNSLVGYTDESGNQVKGVLDNILPAVEKALVGVAKFVEGAVPKLAQMLPGLISTILPSVISAAVSFVESLSAQLPSLLKILISTIIDSAPQIIEGMVLAFESIVEALPELIMLIADALPELMPLIIVGLAKAVIILVQNLPAILSSLGRAFLGFFEGAWEGIKQVFSLEAVQKFFSNVWNGIKKAFGAVADWFTGIFSDAWKGVMGVFSAGGKIFNGIKEGIAGVFKTVVNGIIKGINVVIAAPFKAINKMLNKIKGVSIAGVKPFNSFWKKNPLPVPQIPLLYRGGVLERGQIGLLEGNGAEAVVPLENNKKWIAKVADDMKKATGFGGGGNTYNIEITVNGANYQNERQLATEIAERIQQMTERRMAVYA